MADDIDIEEHDVLDNPQLRNIFPDLSRIKEEVIELDQEEEQDHEIYEPYPSEDFNISEHSFQISEPYKETLTYIEDSQEYPRHQNKIILGSKPSGESLNIKVEPDDVLEPKCISLVTSKDYPMLRNLLISKSANNSEDEDSDTDEEEEEIKQSTVLLEDWGPKLQASKCFCKECEILFPTRNALDAHKMSAHSFLVALDTNKAIKSTAKDFRGGAASSSAFGVQVPGTSKFCNHCNKTFENDTTLISHLYQILTSGKSNSKKTPAKKDPMLPELETKDLESPEVNSNLFLRCCVCGVYFRKQVAYEKHVINGHGVLKPSLDRQPYNGKCWFCPVQLLNQENYNKHTLRSHPKCFYNKKFFNTDQKTFQTASETANITNNIDSKSIPQALKYQCIKCYEIFPDYTAARSHKKVRHPEMKNAFIFSKMYTRKNVPSFTIKKTKPVNNPQNVDYPIPIQYLFHCKNCNIHFTNFLWGLQHSKNCKKTKGDWKCEQCRRTFMLHDKDIHTKQHAINRDVFHVLPCNEDLYHQVISTCPKCKLNFHEKEFRAHFKNGCDKSISVNCLRCNISMESSSLKTHIGFHEKYDFDIDDLILVKFAPKDVNISLKRKFESIEEVITKKPRLSGKVILYYCSYCKCSMLSRRYFDLHSEGECVNIKYGKKFICKICGIMVSSKRHAEFHERNKNWKLSNFRFINLQNRKPINPPIPDYPTCKECGVRVIQSSALENHECGANYKSCWYCKKKFTDLAYLLHVRLHSRKDPKSDTFDAEFTKTVPKASTRTTAVQSPDLLKMYEMLTETWNILYLCCTCDIIHDSYDFAVQHCQNHFNKMESYDVTIRRCQTCDLKFDSKCYEKHIALHFQNKDVRKESFHILYYSYEDLLLPKWLDIFQSLPEEQSEHILKQSIYKNSRNLKMTIIGDGPPEYTLYVCGNCDIYSTTFDFMSHVNCSKVQRRFHCRLCEIGFSAHVVRDAHEAEHEKTENFRIVLFNSPEDSDFNKALSDDKTKNKDHIDVPKESMVHYYRCTKCKCCIKRKDHIKTHECSRMNNRKYCGRCGLTFWRAAIAQHVLLHRTNPYCTREHIQLTDFTPSSSLQTGSNDFIDKTAKIFKCPCGLHFISSKTIEKHLRTCGTEDNIAKENCSKCNLLFDTHELFNHLCKHHSSDKYTKFDVEEVTAKKPAAKKDPGEILERKSVTNATNRDNTKVLYKCKKCDIYYMTANSLKYHNVYNKHHTNDSEKCKLCGLRFSPISLKKHVRLHHVKHKYKLKDFQVIVIDYKYSANGILQVSNKWYHNPTKMVPTKGKKGAIYSYSMSKTFLSTLNLKLYSQKIYKCNKCALHFISSQSLYSHKHNEEGRYCNSSNKGVKCEICGFAFSIFTYPRHKYIHHDKMKLRNVVVIADPFDGKTPKPHSKKRNVISQKLTPNVKVKTNSDIFRKVKPIKGLDVNDYDNTLYQCGICKIHFLTIYSVKGHFMKKKHNLTKTKCKLCGYVFTEQSLIRHVYVHHQKMKLKRKDFKVIVNIFNYGLTRGDEHTSQTDEQMNESDEHDTETDEQENKIAEQNAFEVVENDVKNIELSKREYTASELFKYYSTVYKCGLCDSHFLRPKSILTHYRTDGHNNESSKCNECGLTFTIITMRIHKRVHHDIMKLKKRGIRVVKINKKSVIVGSQIYDENIFKCVTCDMHFANMGTADQHLINVDDVHENCGFKCDVCRLSFGSKALAPHMQIHHEQMRLKLEDFNIHLIGTGIEGTKHNETEDNVSEDTPEYSSQSKDSNILYKCSLCSVHFFNVNTLDSHCQRLSGKIHDTPSSTCSQCNLKFSEKMLSRHQADHHDRMKLEAEDFQIIPFYEYDGNFFGNNYLYRCRICKSHFSRISSLEAHCKAQTHSNRKMKCDLCGFQFQKKGYHKHVTPYHKQMKLRRQDIQVFEIVDGKLVPVDVDDVDENDPKEVQVLDPQTEEESDIEESSITFSEQAKLDVWKSTLDLNEYDNTIYKCKNCPLHFTTLLTVKTHSNCRRKSSNTMRACSVCGLIFGPVTLPKHMFIHHEFHQLKKEDFRIIEWPSDAEKSKDVQTVNLESSRVATRYKNEQELNFTRRHLQSHKKYSNTIYRCNKCDLHFLTSASFKIHAHDIVYKSKCSECGLFYTNRAIGNHKLVHHRKLKLKLEDLEIIDSISNIMEISSIDSEMTRDTDLESVASRVDVDQNDSLDASDLLAETSSISTNVSENSVRPRTSNTNDVYDETLYRCERCDACFMDNNNSKSHLAKCTGKMIKLACEICSFSFPIKSISKHKTVHHDHLKLSRDNFKIVPLGESIDTKGVKDRSLLETENALPDLSTLDKSLYNNELYKCSICNIHFIGKNDFQVHMTNNNHEISRYHCTICTLPFSVRALPIHIFIHHEEMKLSAEHFFIITDKDIDQNSRKTNDITFTTDGSEEDSLNQNNDKAFKTSSLSGCQVRSTRSKETNNTIKVNIDDSLVQSSSDLDSSVETSKILEIEQRDEKGKKIIPLCIKLYKCGDCNVYFMSQPTCYKHMLKHKPLDSIEYIECKICGFQFRIMSLHKHVTKHHNNKEFKLENVLIEEYLPNENGTPTLDIYYAKDKLQFRLISTTSERCTVTSTKGNDVSPKTTSAKTSMKPCTITSKDFVEGEGTGFENISTGSENGIIKSENIFAENNRIEKVKIENISTNEECVQDSTVKDKIASEQQSVRPGNDSIEVNNASTEANNDEIEASAQQSIRLGNDSIGVDNVSTEANNDEIEASAHQSIRSGNDSIAVDSVSTEANNDEIEASAQQNIRSGNDSIGLNNASSNEEIEVIEDKEFEKMSSEIVNIITSGYNVNSSPAKNFKKSICTKNSNSDEPIVYIIDDDDELVDKSSDNKKGPEVTNNKMSLDIANDNQIVLEDDDDVLVDRNLDNNKGPEETNNKMSLDITNGNQIVLEDDDDVLVDINSDDKKAFEVANNEMFIDITNDNQIVFENETEMIIDDNLEVHNIKLENEKADNSLLTESVEIIDSSDDENQFDVDNLAMEKGTKTQKNVAVKHENIIEIE